MHYRSKLEVLGLPLVHVAVGPAGGSRGRRGVARGFVAVGDVAFGVVLAVGGVAFGGVAFGGIGVGVLAIGGVALGGYALGGLAVGVIALGGAAIGARAALGGLAVARDYAIGGLAIADHANDAAAMELARGSALRYGKWVADHAYWFLVLLILPVLLGRRSQKNVEGTDPPRREDS